MSLRELLLIILICCSLQTVLALSEGDEICLYSPYVTSISNVLSNAVDEASQKQKHLTFTLDLMLEFQIMVRVENITVSLKYADSSLKELEKNSRPEFNVANSKITYRGKSDEYTLTQDRDPVNNKLVSRTSEQFYEDLKQFQNSLRGQKVPITELKGKLGYCTLANDADFYLPLYGNNGSENSVTKSTHYRFRGQRVCEGTTTVNTTTIKNYDEYARRSATFLHDNHLLQFLPNGTLSWTTFKTDKIKPTNIEDLFAIKHSESLFNFSNKLPSSYEDRATYTLTSNKCREPLDKLVATFDDLNVKERDLNMPMATITKFSRDNWGFREELIVPNGRFHSWFKGKLTKTSLTTSKSLEHTQLQAYSALYQFDNTTRGESGNVSALVYWNEGKHELFYQVAEGGKKFIRTYEDESDVETTNNMDDIDPIKIISVDLINTTIETRKFMSNTVFLKLVNAADYPDDIVHWSSCKKLITFYGYLYALHNYDDQFIQKPAEWHLLDYDLFPLPPEAVHAEGDEFWFFSKLWDVDIMIADSSDCNKLTLRRKKNTMHIHDLFQITSKWTPQLAIYEISHDKWITPQSITSDSSILIYILAFLGITLIIALLVMFFIMRYGRDQNTAVTRSKTSQHTPMLAINTERSDFISGSKGISSRKSPQATFVSRGSRSPNKSPRAVGSPGIRKSVKSSPGSRGSAAGRSSPGSNKKSPRKSQKSGKTRSKSPGNKRKKHSISPKESQQAISNFLAPN